MPLSSNPNVQDHLLGGQVGQRGSLQNAVGVEIYSNYDGTPRDGVIHSFNNLKSVKRPNTV